jgi:hypothetical protein
MSHFNNISFERISEEANGDAHSLQNTSDSLEGFDLDLFNESSLSDFAVHGICDFVKLAQSAPGCVEQDEFDGYLGMFNSPNQSVECENNRALMNNLPRQIITKEKQFKSSINPISLSQSVGVGLPQHIRKISPKVHILYPLEEFFRPRYKSDYFAQNGKSRGPRYVADRTGNHFIAIKVPTNVRGKIRVDWLTIPDKSGDRYSMPYRFQQNNEVADVPDCNPIYININADKNGTMKVYLVLIKSKQDELKNLQPLKPFHPLKDVFGMLQKPKIESSYPLNPKQLIQTYQLDQSQLAFTFCGLASDGQTPIPEWDTTVFSTVLTEMPTEAAKQKAITCPNCSHLFHISNNEQDSIQETGSNKRKAYANSNARIIKKQNSVQDDSAFC